VPTAFDLQVGKKQTPADAMLIVARDRASRLFRSNLDGTIAPSRTTELEPLSGFPRLGRNLIVQILAAKVPKRGT
jgi:hypothetical protein